MSNRQISPGVAADADRRFDEDRSGLWLSVSIFRAIEALERWALSLRALRWS